MKYLISSGIIVLISGLYLAFIDHSPIWYSFFLVGSFLFLEGINQKKGYSLLKNWRAFLLVWLIFIAITILTEWIGKFALHAWEYPHFGRIDYLIHVILIGYPIAFFVAIEFFVIIKRYVPKNLLLIMLPISAIIFGYLNEIPNLFAYEWKYREMMLGNVLGIPILVSFLWLLILLVQLFEKYFWDKTDTGS
jgi:hypothetical protein